MSHRAWQTRYANGNFSGCTGAGAGSSTAVSDRVAFIQCEGDLDRDSDTDGDGVPNVDDRCRFAPIRSPAQVNGTLIGNATNDCGVVLKDYASFQRVYGNEQPPRQCVPSTTLQNHPGSATVYYGPLVDRAMAA